MTLIDITTDTDKQAVKAVYQEAIARLGQIENADPQAITQAQAVAAIQDIARFLRLLLKFLYKRFIA